MERGIDLKLWIVNHYAIPPQYGGLNRHYYFSKELRKYGIETRILSSSKIHNTDINFATKDLYTVVNSDGVDYTFIRSSDYKGNGLSRIFSFIQFPWNVSRAMRLFLKSERPDVIYASSPELFSTAVAVKFAKKRKIPILVEVRDLWPESVVAHTKFSDKNLIIKILYRLEKWIYENADILNFTFAGGKDYISNKGWDMQSGGKIELSKVRNVNNGVDLEAFDREAEDNVIDDEWLNSDKFKVVYTGSVRKVNTIGLLVDAAKMLSDMNVDDVSIIIYGNGTEKEELEARVRDYGLDNIVFRGRVEKKYVAGILKRSDLNVFVGKGDSMNKYGLSLNKLFDYMASGKPILTNITSGYDNIIKYDCGKVVPKNDVQAIAKGILEFKNMKHKDYERYCKNALMASKNFDYNILSDKIKNILLELQGVNYEKETIS